MAYFARKRTSLSLVRTFLQAMHNLNRTARNAVLATVKLSPAGPRSLFGHHSPASR